jgi:uncharacterized peroxidase-related enzyme
MFLTDLQSRPPEGMMRIAFKKLRDAGRAVPKILHLFRFKKRGTNHLVRFTDEVMRGPSPLSHGLRELIGTFVSSRNQCGFCSCAHAPVAAELLGKELVDEVLRDPETSRLDQAHKELFRYVGKLAENPALVGAPDVDRLKRAGWSEEAIYDALTVASLFKFYNTWNNGSGVQAMNAADYAHSGSRLITLGYCMDFSFIGILKVVWVARKEITISDLIEILNIWLGRKGTNHLPSRPRALAGRESGQPAVPVASRSCAVDRRKPPSRRPLPAGGSGKVRATAPV